MQYPSYNRTGEKQLTLSDFSGGIDAASADTALAVNRLRDAENLWWKDGVLKTRPGVVVAATLSYELPTVHLQAAAPERILIDGESGHLQFFIHETAAADGYALAVFFCRLDGQVTVIRRQTETADWTTLPTQLLPINDGKELGLIYVDAVPYRLGTDGTLSSVKPYVPTVVIAARGSADKATARAMTAPAGTSYEPFNRLTDSFKVEYLITEGNPYFTLPSLCRHRTGQLYVEVLGYNTLRYTVNSTVAMSDITTTVFAGYKLTWSTPLGLFWFTADDAVCVPDPDKFRTIRATFTPSSDEPDAKETVKAMRFSMWFGGSMAGLSGGTRCFLSGSADDPSLLLYSGVQDATYFPENNDAHIGHPGQAITALCKQSDMLVIFKEHEIWYSCYQTGMTDTSALTAALEDGSVVDVEAVLATFPLGCISADIGCDCPATIALCDNRLVWTNADGQVYVLASGNIYSERNVRSIGTGIRPLLTARPVRAAADYGSHYCLLAGTELFLFDYNTAALATVTASTSDESLQKRMAWYRWRLPNGITPDGLFADGDRLMLPMFDTETGTLHTYLLDGDTDAPDGISVPISFSVQWPMFSLARTGARQTVSEVTLDTGLPDTALTVIPVGDRDDGARHSRRIRTDSAGIARFFAGLRRVRQFSLRLQAEGSARLRGLTMTIY